MGRKDACAESVAKVYELWPVKAITVVRERGQTTARVTSFPSRQFMGRHATTELWCYHNSIHESPRYCRAGTEEEILGKVPEFISYRDPDEERSAASFEIIQRPYVPNA